MSIPELGSKKRRENKKTTINRHEKELASKLGGHRQPMSGALPAHKGDIKLDKFLLDSKETTFNSIVVSGADLAKIQLEAQELGKYPGLVLSLKTGATVPGEWVLVPLEVFVSFLEQLKGNNGT